MLSTTATNNSTRKFSVGLMLGFGFGILIIFVCVIVFVSFGRVNYINDSLHTKLGDLGSVG